jgi:hypothetical protein
VADALNRLLENRVVFYATLAVLLPIVMFLTYWACWYIVILF